MRRGCVRDPALSRKGLGLCAVQVLKAVVGALSCIWSVVSCVGKSSSRLYRMASRVPHSTHSLFFSLCLHPAVLQDPALLLSLCLSHVPADPLVRHAFLESHSAELARDEAAAFIASN